MNSQTKKSQEDQTRRDPQQEKLLPGYGLLYFDNLYGEYRSLPAERVIPEVKAIVDEILMKKQNASLTWDDLYTFDLFRVWQRKVQNPSEFF
jgi:hypothetical protein